MITKLPRAHYSRQGRAFGSTIANNIYINLRHFIAILVFSGIACCFPSSCSKKPFVKYYNFNKTHPGSWDLRPFSFRGKFRYNILVESRLSRGAISASTVLVDVTPEPNPSISHGEFFECNWGDPQAQGNQVLAMSLVINESHLQGSGVRLKIKGIDEKDILRVRLMELDP